MQQLPVSALMRVCPDAVICETTTLRAAAEVLLETGLATLIVHDASGSLAGIVPETAVIRELMATTSQDATVASILSRHAESVRPDALLTSVLHLFRSSCHCVIPVIDDTEAIVGLLHRQDVVRLLLSETDDAGLPDGRESSHALNRKPHFLNGATIRSQRSESSGGHGLSAE